MIIRKLALPRRTVLRGLGATLALPLLDGMVPALTAMANTPAKPPVRLGVLYAPNGIQMENWTPKTEGTAYEMTPILQPLAPFREQMTVVSGTNSLPNKVGLQEGAHPPKSTRFLTGVPPTYKTAIKAGVSMD